MSIKLKDLLNYDIKPFLFGVLFSRITTEDTRDIPEKVYAYTSFRKSKAVNYTDFDFIEYSNALQDKYNELSGYKNWMVKTAKEGSMELRFPIENNLNTPIETINDLVYKRLIKEDWLYDESLNAEKKDFMRGFMETRGSIDTTASYITQDYFYNNRRELKRINIFTDRIEIPYSYLNFNPRQLQNDYVTGKSKRNTQFRVNLHYYVKNFGFYNKYKALIYEKSYGEKNSKVIIDDVIYFLVNVPDKNDDVNFVKYTNFFTDNIYEKELNTNNITALRESLGFYNVNSTKGKSRNQTIIDIFNAISPDECALCGTTETFLQGNSDRQAFEVHHLIPYHNGIHYDNMANLVKLCPTCHSSLKKGRSPKEEQIKSIIKILFENNELYEYASNALGINDINKLAEEIQEMLG